MEVRDNNISMQYKIILLCALILFIFLYACKTWTLTAELQRKIQALEMRCYRTILGISYLDHLTNDQVCSTLQQHIGPHDDLLTTVKKRKLRWYGHMTRSNGLVKTDLQGIVERGRKSGRQKKKWNDNI